MKKGFLFQIPQKLLTDLQEISQEISWKKIDSLTDLKTQVENSSVFILCVGQDFDLIKNISQLNEILTSFSQLSLVIFSDPFLDISQLNNSSVYRLPQHPTKEDLQLLNSLILEDFNISEHQELQQIGKEYRASIFTKLYTILKLSQNYEKDPSQQVQDELKRSIHKFAGSAGLYGYEAVSQECKNYEKILDHAKETNSPLSSSDLQQYFQKIHKAFLIKKQIPSAVNSAPPPSSQPENKKSLPNTIDVFIIDDDVDLLKNFEVESKNHSLNVSFEKSFKQAKEILSDPSFSPEILIVDLYSEEDKDITGYDLIQIFKNSRKTANETITAILSAKGSLKERKQANELPVDIYFEKPISASTFFYQLKKIKHSKKVTSYKILLLDDDLDFCQLLEKLLKPPLFQLIYKLDPINFFKELEAVRPDLLLLDLNFPNFHGLDLLKTLRTDYRFKKLSVIIISVEEEIHLLKEAFKLGIDDYIIKPVETEHFTDQILSILKKRQIQDIFYEKDPLFNVYIKNSLLQLFNNYSANYKLLSVATINFSALESHPIDASFIKKTLAFINNFFSRKDLLGIWSPQFFILLIPHLAINQLRLSIDNLYKEIQNKNLLDKNIGLNTFLANYPSDGVTLDEIEQKAVSTLSSVQGKSIWKIFSSREMTSFYHGKNISTLFFITSNDILFNLVEYALQPGLSH